MKRTFAILLLIAMLFSTLAIGTHAGANNNNRKFTR